MIEVVPAVLAKSWDELTDSVELVHAFAKSVQIDVVDGHFARHKTWPYKDRATFDKIVKEERGLPHWEKLDFEFDLMINDPAVEVGNFVRAGASRVVLHASAPGTDAALESLADMREPGGEFYVRVGIALSIGGEPHDVTIPASINNEERTITLNVPTEVDGVQVLDNDLQRVQAKVELSDVPSSPTFRTQQLQTLGGAFESMPPQYQAIALPHLLNLMDIPNKDEILEAVKKISQQPTQEDIDKLVQDAVQKALVEKLVEQKDRELSIKEKVADADIQVQMKEAIKKGVEAAFSAMQTGAIIMQNPQIAPVGDDVLDMAANYPNAPTNDTVTPVPAGVVMPQGVLPGPIPVEQPAGPPNMAPVERPGYGMAPESPSPNIGVEQGMTTPDTGDNLGGPTE